MDGPSLQDQIRTLREKLDAETIDFVRDALRQRIEELEAKLAEQGNTTPGESNGGSAATDSEQSPRGSCIVNFVEADDLGLAGSSLIITRPTTLEDEDEETGAGVTENASPLEGEGQPPDQGQPPAENGDAETLPATPEQLEAADRLIAQARLEKSRGNRGRSSELLQQAAQAAPGAASVLEMLGDDQTERKQYTKARDTFAQALRSEPNNVGLQTKHAEAVLRASAHSVDGMLGLDGALNPEDRDSGAAWIDILAPGLGQCFRGRWGVGLVLLAVWLTAVVFLVLHNQPRDLADNAPRGNQTLGVVAILVVAALHLGSLANVLFTVRSTAPKRNVEKPRPPVDLPFE